MLHASLYPLNCFITLTYDESKNTYHNNFNYKDIQDFKKRLRSQVWRDHKRRVQIFNVHEYGKNGKKHWHLIVFNHDFRDKTLYSRKNGIPIYTSVALEKLWPHGYNTIGDVTAASAMYQAQYVEKDFRNNYVTTKLKSHSKHQGLGRPYFLKHYKQLLSLGFIPMNGRKVPLPRYFEKLAHKHFSHFYEKSNFFDQKIGKRIYRKALYRPFKIGEENKEIADLWTRYAENKKEHKEELEKEWQDVISQYLTTKEIPDFIKSGENALYDLRNQNLKESF